MRRMILPLMLVMMTACRPEVGPLSDADIAAITGLHDATEQAVMARDWDALLSLYADDAVRLAPREAPALGRTAIRERLEPYTDITFVERDNRIRKIDGSGDVAYVWSTVTQRTVWAGEDDVSESGAEMLRTLRRQPDGSWRFTLDIWHYHADAE